MEQDEIALEEVMRRHGPAVLRTATLAMRDASLAEDIVQTVFLGLWQKPSIFDPDRGSLRSFLLMQCHGKCVDLIRSRNARTAREAKALALGTNVPVPIDREVMLGDTTTGVRRSLAVLTHAERDVIELAFFGGHTYRVVAVLLGLPEGTVKARIRSALSRLYDVLSRDEYQLEYGA